MSFVGGIGKRKSTFNIVRQVNVDDATLKKIADALGIPASEHDRIESISGEISISPAPSQAGGGTPTHGGSSQGSSGGYPQTTGTTGRGR
jgi:hypothetical protein